MTQTELVSLVFLIISSICVLINYISLRFERRKHNRYIDALKLHSLIMKDQLDEAKELIKQGVRLDPADHVLTSLRGKDLTFYNRCVKLNNRNEKSNDTGYFKIIRSFRRKQNS